MMIELSQVRKTFNQGKPNEFTAVDGINLFLEGGRITVFKGPSGAGKTTILSLIGCMARPTSGRIRLLGREITSLPERFLTQIRRSTFGFIFQQWNLIRGIDTLENVMLPAYPTGEPRGRLMERAAEILRLLGMEGRARAGVEWLSGGEAQRVTIARALINNPSVVIADEPTAHLDSRLSEEFMEIMVGLRERGKTVIIASHDPIVHEHPAVERVIEVRDGRIEGSRG